MLEKTISEGYKIQKLKHPGRSALKATGDVELEFRKRVGLWMFREPSVSTDAMIIPSIDDRLINRQNIWRTSNFSVHSTLSSLAHAKPHFSLIF